MINRSTVNTPQVRAKDFPHSALNLSYKSRADFILGRLHPVAYQWIMPGDKFRTKCDLKHTFNTLSVPEISDVNISLHHFFVTLRSIDTSFLDAMAPNELNGMSKDWRTPMVSLQSLVRIFLSSNVGFYDQILDSLNSGTDYDWGADISGLLRSFKSSYSLRYYLDVFDDFADYAEKTAASGSLQNKDVFLAFLDALFTPLFGENSLLDVLGFPYLRRKDYVSLWEIYVYTRQEEPDSITLDTFVSWFSDVPFNEYPLRAYYAVWYEHYRDKQIEKRTHDLPDWRKFGSTSVFQTIGDLFCFLSLRIRSWSQDMFTTSLPDDPSRHVFAPIINTTTGLQVSDDEYNYLDAELSTISVGKQGFSNLQIYPLSFRDPVSGEEKTVECPIPKSVNDALNNLDSSIIGEQAFGLDLRDLRKSQMVERYLKRNFYFGDEYQDRMLAHYGSRVSDNSIRRPYLILSETQGINPIQEVSSMPSDGAPAGTRTATVQDNITGDKVSMFAEEFGIYICIASFIPTAQYAGICPQVLISQMTDFPIPEFAPMNDETGRILEIAFSGIHDARLNSRDLRLFGHYPYAHAWRSRVDEVHGRFLSDRQNYTFRRFFGMDNDDSIPKLNFEFLHCKPNLGMFEDTVRLSGQGYYTNENHFYVERVLPTPVEEI